MSLVEKNNGLQNLPGGNKTNSTSNPDLELLNDLKKTNNVDNNDSTKQNINIAQEQNNRFLLFMFDKDGDKKLNSDEISDYLHSSEGFKLNDGSIFHPSISIDIVTDDLKKYDKNHNGSIDTQRLSTKEQMTESSYLFYGEEEKKKDKTVLNTFDKDGDGKLNLNETNNYFEFYRNDPHQHSISVDIVTDDVKKFDISHDGQIGQSDDEIKRDRECQAIETNAEIMKFDKDGDGKLNASEIGYFLDSPNRDGYEISTEFLIDDLKKCDTNNDGFITNYYNRESKYDPETKTWKTIRTINIDEEARLLRKTISQAQEENHKKDLQTKENNQTLDIYDQDGDRKLNTDELKAYFIEHPGNSNDGTFVDSKVSLDLVTDDLKQYDKNNDGFISYNVKKGWSEGEAFLNDNK